MKTFGTALNDEFGAVEETGIMITIKDIYESKKHRHMETLSETVCLEADEKDRYYRASNNPSRYAYVAAKMLSQKSIPFVPVGIKKESCLVKRYWISGSNLPLRMFIPLHCTLGLITRLNGTIIFYH